MNNPLQKLFGGLSLGKEAENSAVGIDIGSSSIKVVEIKRKGSKAILETYGAIVLGPYDNKEAGQVANLPVDKTGEALKEVLKQSGVTSGIAAFSIPIQSSLIFTIELPTQITESEMKTIIP